jgi:hypothetical protein
VANTLREMAEDWRVTVRLNEAAELSHALKALHEHRVEQQIGAGLGGPVAVSGSGDELFLYADTEAGARAASGVVTTVLTAQQIGVRATTLERWHHDEERWEDARLAAPSTPEAEHTEHERLEQQEARESQTTGVAPWELRIEFGSHHDARVFAERLGSEGFRHLVRRWRFLLVGVDDRDDALAWAQRLSDELPPGATVHVEPGGGLAWEFRPNSAFAVFGGMAA